MVSALYEIPPGIPRPLAEIQSFKELIEETPEGKLPLKWSVVESIPVHEYIKLSKAGSDKYVTAFIESMKNLAACDIRTIC